MNKKWVNTSSSLGKTVNQTDNAREFIPIIADDRSVKDILYSRQEVESTVVDIYLAAEELIHKLEAKPANEIFAMLADFVKKGNYISCKQALQLVEILSPYLPRAPYSILSHDVSMLGPLIKQIHSVILRCNNHKRNFITFILYRWYEHHEFYSKARAVIREALKNTDHTPYSSERAILLNNLAYDYLFEGRAREAVTGFKKAAELFRKLNINGEAANAEANYFTALFMYKGVDTNSRTVKKIKKLLSSFNYYEYRIRKMYMLLARIYRKQGDISRAIELTEKAIKAGEKSGTSWPEMDREFLQDLERMK